MIQKTLVLIKPDAMKRGLVGEIISRFERVGLKIVDCQLIQADEKLAGEHYPVTDEWLNKVGNNTLSDSKKYGVDTKEIFGTSDPVKIGKMVHLWNMEFIQSGKILAIVLEGVHAVEAVRKLCGATLPLLASPGTIRGDFSSESALSSNMKNQPIRNLVHSSGNPAEAKREIKLWFGHD